MTKAVLNDLVNLDNQTSAVNTINANNAVIETAFDNTLSRDGAGPNTMGTNLDMNSFNIINLPTPGSPTSPIRVQDVLTGIGTTAAPTGTSGHSVPFLDTLNTWSLIQTFTAGLKISAGGGILDFSNTTTIFRDTTDGSLNLTSQTGGVKLPKLNISPGLGLPAGGSTSMGITFSTPSANFGIFVGSGIPTMIATRGSLYLRTDGSSTSTRMYVNIDSNNGWTSVVTTA